jgi:hypothetical protein
MYIIKKNSEICDKNLQPLLKKMGIGISPIARKFPEPMGKAGPERRPSKASLLPSR